MVVQTATVTKGIVETPLTIRGREERNLDSGKGARGGRSHRNRTNPVGRGRTRHPPHTRHFRPLERSLKWRCQGSPECHGSRSFEMSGRVWGDHRIAL